MSNPTNEQQKIIDDSESCVVIAKPGSGKTFTLSQKIKIILETLPPYKGVIAISFTNKASDELKHRTLQNGIDKKGSFFGTIDRFCISEIVLPYLRYMYGLPKKDLEVIKINESALDDSIKEDLEKAIKNKKTIDSTFIRERYLEGEVYLELVGQIAIRLFDKLSNLKSYLKARYSHVIVDEYQDSGEEQHQIFERLHSIGLKAIAVGDLDQSIYAFSGKSSKFLLDLTKREGFNKYSLTKNHRCHPSISAYSIKLFDPAINLEETEEKRVYLKSVNGSEVDIAKWIDGAIPKIKEKFEVKKSSNIGVLVRSNRTASIIAKNLKHPVQIFEETLLDSYTNPWARFFSEGLKVIFDRQLTFNDMIEKYMDIEENRFLTGRVLSRLITVKNHVQSGKEISNYTQELISCAKMIAPKNENFDATTALVQVCSDKELMRSYLPPQENALQLMTLHKSKGLEFSVVFHLDLYQWIIPTYKAIKERDQEELVQSLNLHYVGITRAKDVCILCTSSRRHRNENEVTDAQPSEFLNRSGLISLRKSLSAG